MLELAFHWRISITWQSYIWLVVFTMQYNWYRLNITIFDVDNYPDYNSWPHCRPAPPAHNQADPSLAWLWWLSFVSSSHLPVYQSNPRAESQHKEIQTKVKFGGKYYLCFLPSSEVIYYNRCIRAVVVVMKINGFMLRFMFGSMVLSSPLFSRWMGFIPFLFFFFFFVKFE